MTNELVERVRDRSLELALGEHGTVEGRGRFGRCVDAVHVGVEPPWARSVQWMESRARSRAMTPQTVPSSSTSVSPMAWESVACGSKSTRSTL